jgi:hypothetical protein
MVHHVAPNGKVRALMANLFDIGRFPASAFGDLYHKRWRIAETFKRLKHRLNLEHVSGLSQQAVVQDVVAKIICDNLQTLAALTANDYADLRAVDRINHAYAYTGSVALTNPAQMSVSARFSRPVSASSRQL